MKNCAEILQDKGEVGAGYRFQLLGVCVLEVEEEEINVGEDGLEGLGGSHAGGFDGGVPAALFAGLE